MTNWQIGFLIMLEAPILLGAWFMLWRATGLPGPFAKPNDVPARVGSGLASVAMFALAALLWGVNAPY